MKPLRLEIKGLNSFITKQVIDFSELTEYGLFGIFGPTGSGKTTILDGITLALYGKIARKSKNFININCDMASILFEFQISGKEKKRYRVERSFKQDQKTGGVKTGQCRLTDITEEPVILADKVTELNSMCQQILGLSAEDFQRTVVLPQGKFSEFLKLEGNERSKMLERLFQLEQYGEILTAKLKEKKDKEELVMAEINGQVNTYTNLSPDSLATMENEKNKISKLLEIQQRKSEALEEQYEKEKEIWNIQEELKEYQRKQNVLMSQKTEMKELKVQLKMSERAEGIFPFLEAWEDTGKKLKNVSIQVEKLQEEVKLAEQEKGRVEEAWQKVKERKNSRIPYLQEMNLKLKEAIRIKGEQEKLILETNKIMGDIGTLNTEKKTFQKRIDGIMKKIEDSSANISFLEKSAQEFYVDAILRTKVSNGFFIEKQIQLVQEQCKAEEIKQELEINKMEKESLEQQKLQKDLQKAGMSGHRPEDFNVFQKELIQNKNKLDQYEKIKDVLAGLEKKMETWESKTRKAKEKKENYQKTSESLERKVQEMETEFLAVKLRSQLISGQPCPVCGSLYHENMMYDKSDTSELEKEKRLLNQEKQSLLKAEGEVIRTATESESIKEQWQKQKEQLDMLGTCFLEHTNDEYDRFLQKLTLFREKLSEEKTRKQNLEMIQESVLQSKSKLQELLKNKESLVKDTAIFDFSEMSKKLDEMDQQFQESDKKLKLERKKTEEYQNVFQGYREKAGEIVNQLTGKTEALFQKNSQKEEKACQLSVLVKDNPDRKQLEEMLTCLIAEKDQIEKEYVEIEKQQEKTLKNYEVLSRKRIETISQVQIFTEREKMEKEKLEDKLREQQFETVLACQEAMMEKALYEQEKRRVENYEKNIYAINSLVANTLKKLGEQKITQEEWDQLQDKRQECKMQLEEIKNHAIQIGQQLQEMQKKWDILKELLKEQKEHQHQLGLLDDLFKLFRGKRFVEYVAYSKLKYISVAAGKRLYEISNGNFGLEVNAEGKFVICDYKNGGVKRDTSTLSGGETFLVSLSLSLALSEQIQLKGAAPLELFFLDEGFGTLDENLLDTVMDSLEKVQNDRLKVGIISHVEAIKARVPAKLFVIPGKAGMGGSKIRMEKN